MERDMDFNDFEDVSALCIRQGRGERRRERDRAGEKRRDDGAIDPSLRSFFLSTSTKPRERKKLETPNPGPRRRRRRFRGLHLLDPFRRRGPLGALISALGGRRRRRRPRPRRRPRGREAPPPPPPGRRGEFLPGAAAAGAAARRVGEGRRRRPGSLGGAGVAVLRGGGRVGGWGRWGRCCCCRSGEAAGGEGEGQGEREEVKTQRSRREEEEREKGERERSSCNKQFSDFFSVQFLARANPLSRNQFLSLLPRLI